MGFRTTAVFKSQSFRHFGVNSTNAVLYGDNEKDIKEVWVELHEDQRKPSFQEQKDSGQPDYWGFLETGKESMSLIFPQLFLLEMCFPAGIAAEEERGCGKAYRVTVQEL